MPVLRGVECCIYTEKGKLTEYEGKGVSEQNGAKGTRHLDITGAEGQNFWVELRALQDFEWGTAAFNCLAPSVVVDGVALSAVGAIRPLQIYQYYGPMFSKLEDGKNVSTISEMIFQPLKLVQEEGGEDTINKSDDSRLQSLGRIEVLVHRTMRVATNVPWIGQPVTTPLRSVHEKAIKWGNSVHGIQLNGSRAHPIQGWRVASDTQLDAPGDPYITFIFLYHTKDTLISLGLLRMAAGPVEIIDDDNDDEIALGQAKLKKEIEALTAQLNKRKATLKRHYGGEDESTDPGPPTKRERKSTPQASTTRNPLELVDLTREA